MGLHVEHACLPWWALIQPTRYQEASNSNFDSRSWSCDDYVVLGKRACPDLTTRLALSNLLVTLLLPFTTFISLTSPDNFSSRTHYDPAHSRPLSLPTGNPRGISLPIWMGLNSAVIKVFFKLICNLSKLVKAVLFTAQIQGACQWFWQTRPFRILKFNWSAQFLMLSPIQVLPKLPSPWLPKEYSQLPLDWGSQSPLSQF